MRIKNSLYVIAVLLLSLFIAEPVIAQKITIDTALRNKLDQMLEKDQQYRQLMQGKRRQNDSLALVFNIPADSVNTHLWKLQKQLDSINMLELDSIFTHRGYPGKSLVGVPDNRSAWYLIMHSTRKIKQYLPIIEDAARKNELPYTRAAEMEDKMLMSEFKEQLYGTQTYTTYYRNDSLNKYEVITFIWPVKDAAEVNQRRKEAGFGQTIEEYAKGLRIDYKVFTMQDVDALLHPKPKNE